VSRDAANKVMRRVLVAPVTRHVRGCPGNSPWVPRRACRRRRSRPSTTFARSRRRFSYGGSGRSARDSTRFVARPGPYSTADAWCRDRCAEDTRPHRTERRYRPRITAGSPGGRSTHSGGATTSLRGATLTVSRRGKRRLAGRPASTPSANEARTGAAKVLGTTAQRMRNATRRELPLTGPTRGVATRR
jgi:hypothetical protein